MPYTLLKFALWFGLAALIGFVIGWALRSLQARVEMARLQPSPATDTTTDATTNTTTNTTTDTTDGRAGGGGDAGARDIRGPAADDGGDTRPDIDRPA